MKLRKKEAAQREQEEQMEERRRAKDPSERAPPATSGPPQMRHKAPSTTVVVCSHDTTFLPGMRLKRTWNQGTRRRGFVPAQLFTIIHHIEKAQYAAVERGPDTFTLLSYTKTYTTMEYTPPIPPGQEDIWLQTVATTLGQLLGFAAPPKPA